MSNLKPVLTISDYLELCVEKLTVAKNKVAASERDLAAFRRDKRGNAAALVELEAARADAHAEFTQALSAWARAKGPCGSKPATTPNIRVNQHTRDLDALRRREEEFEL